MEKKVQLYIGDQCDLGCQFCTNIKSVAEKRFVSPLILKKALRKYAREKHNVVDLIGGEVSLYPHIDKIIQYATDLGYKRIDFISHGLKFNDNNFLESIVKAGNVRFCVSVESHKEEIEDFLISVKGGFRKKIKGLYNLGQLKKQGLIKEKIFLMTVINKLNYKTIADILIFYYKNFEIKDFRFRFIMPKGKAFNNFKLLVPAYSQVLPSIKKLIALAEKSGLNVSLDGIPFCILKVIKNFKNFTGEFLDRLRGNKGTKGKTGFQKKLSSTEFKEKEARIKMKGCRKCIYDHLCEGPWKNYVKIYGFKEFKPVT